MDCNSKLDSEAGVYEVRVEVIDAEGNSDLTSKIVNVNSIQHFTDPRDGQ